MNLKTVSALLLASAVSSLWAIRPGEKAEELQVKWQQGVPVQLLPDKNTQTPYFKAVTFLLTRGANSAETLQLLERLRVLYGGKVRFAVVTPDETADIALLLKEAAVPDLSIGRDVKRTLTPRYTDGSMLFPMAFLIDQEGVVVWCGEAVDLPETVDKALAGKLNLKVQRKLAPMIDQMQTLLRDTNDRQMRTLVDEALRLDPGNAGVLRLRLYVLENTGRAGEAYELLNRQLDATPRLTRLYFMMLELIGRHAELASLQAALVDRYLKEIAEPDSDNLLAWNLLQRSNDDPAALRAAVRLLERAQHALKADSPRRLQIAVTTTQALVASRLGQNDRALELETPLEKQWQDEGLAENAAASRRRMEYYKAVKELAESASRADKR